MGQGHEQTLIRKGYSINLEIYEKMFIISSNYRNANQNCTEISSHYSQNGNHQEYMQKILYFLKLHNIIWQLINNT